MAVGVERLDCGEAADHWGSRRERPWQPARDWPTNRLAPLIALRFVLHGAAKPAHAFGGVNTLALPRSAQGHEDSLPSPTLSACCRLGKATFGGTHGNEKDAPE